MSTDLVTIMNTTVIKRWNDAPTRHSPFASRSQRPVVRAVTESGCQELAFYRDQPERAWTQLFAQQDDSSKALWFVASVPPADALLEQAASECATWFVSD